MRLFRGKAEKELDAIIRRLEMDMSNNYKDNAQDDLKDFEKALMSLKESKEIKDKIFERYRVRLIGYQETMKGYTHKDQKTTWN